ncbi:MAG: hypothetical protein IPF59_14080 [Ignavibacteria bacterium]|nr:hypothetical protein [Ignavibacteria bacterium]
MIKYPDARLTVGGYRNPPMVRIMVLSSARAEAVSYLVAQWGIDWLEDRRQDG